MGLLFLSGERLIHPAADQFWENVEKRFADIAGQSEILLKQGVAGVFQVIIKDSTDAAMDVAVRNPEILLSPSAIAFIDFRSVRRAGGAQPRVPVYSTEGGWLHLTPEELVAQTLQAKADGFLGAKVKVGRPTVAEDVARLAAVREAVGGQFEIMVDANQCFNVAEAMRRARAYEPFNLAWFEEPLPAEDIGGHVELAARTATPIAIGESLYHPAHFREYLERDACSIVQVDCARIGGVTPWLKVAHLAEAFNVAVCPHFLMELHVSLTAAVPNAAWVEYIPQLDDVTTSRMTIEDGHAVAPAAPGLGIDWDFAAIDARAVARCRVPN